jgi:hypothetical protein
VTAGANSIVGGLVGANAAFSNFPPGLLPESSFPAGTISFDSFATGSASGGPGSTVGSRVGQNNPNSGLPAYPTIVAGCDDPLCAALRTGILLGPSSILDTLPTPQSQVIQNLAGNVVLAALNTSPPVSTSPGNVRAPQFPPPVPPGTPPSQQQQGFQRIIDIPPLTETRFITDQVLVQFRCEAGSAARVEQAVLQFGLSPMATQDFCTTSMSMAMQLRITNGQTVRDILRLLASVQIVGIAQPNYRYELAQEPAGAGDPTPASRGDTAQQGDAAQYILQKLQIADVHRIVRGTNVPIAVIDSEIDAAHPDLAGVIVQRFSAVGAPEKPHSHGTGMAGAIASHQRLMGIAPSARLFAVHAFSSNAASVESTTFNILKGLDWASSQGVRIINMSFAGPKDPSLERALKAAYDKGIVLIAAAGNAGPKSPPLYPGADPSVIAVTATDVDDKLFAGANRGRYVSVAAPGVDILVPAPEGAYQLTTGTSVAAAEVSGIVALLLERNPKLTPADVRRILTGSAKRLAPGERSDDFGSGLVDPLRALQSADPRTVTTTPTLRQR